MRMDPTQSLGLKISASKSASRIEKRFTFDPQKLFGGFEQNKKKMDSELGTVLGTLGPK